MRNRALNANVDASGRPMSEGLPAPAGDGSFFMPERSMATVLVPVSLDLEETLTATDAAEEFGVHRTTIHYWVSRGYLPVAGYDTRDGRRVPVYRRGDVGLAERATRQRALNKRASFAVRRPA